jgi:hypothetical protein
VPASTDASVPPPSLEAGGAELELLLHAAAAKSNENESDETTWRERMNPPLRLEKSRRMNLRNTGNRVSSRPPHCCRDVTDSRFRLLRRPTAGNLAAPLDEKAGLIEGYGVPDRARAKA